MFHFVKIHLIGIPPGRIAIDLPLFGLRGEPAHLTRRVIPVKRSVFTDDLAGSAIDALDVIQMDFAHHAAFESDDNRSNVLGIDFQLT